MAIYNYGAVILGASSAGEGAAMNAFKYGCKLAVVDSHRVVGDNCTYLGTIPPKTLRHSMKQIIRSNINPIFRQIGEPRWFSFPDVLKSVDRVISKQVTLRIGYYARNRIDMLTGTASPVGECTIGVMTPNGAVERLAADQFVIATDSCPYRPPDTNFNHPRIYGSDTIPSLSHTPCRLIIYGAGAIGCEYMSVFSSLGVLVGLISTRDRLLNFLDDKVSDALGYRLRNNSVLVRHNEEHGRVEGLDNGVILHLKSGKKIKMDALLWCNGRTGNTGKPGPENVGVKVNSHGQIGVDENYHTSVSNISAAGGVIDWPSLAGAVCDQGRSTVGSIVESDSRRFVSDVPTGIHATPEIGSIDKSESELIAAKIPYEVGKAFFEGMAWARIPNKPVGILKVLLHRETLEISGMHCFGDRASKIIHTGQVIVNQPGEPNTLEYLVNTAFSYPTMAEVYRVVTFDNLNRLF